MKKIIGIITAVVVLGLLGGGAYWYHTRTMDKLRTQVIQEQRQAQDQKELLDQRMEDIQLKLDNAEQEKESVLKKIDDRLTEEVYYFDSAAMLEEVKEIGELATVEYRYTNVGTLDASKKIFNSDHGIPGTRKSLVVTMDGVIKIGIDMNGIKIASNDNAKTITVTLPKPKLLSNELIEDSMLVYDEKSGVFSRITMEDSSSIRSQIKSKSEENAKTNGVYEQATQNAQFIIGSMLNAIPHLKETYTVIFK